MHTLLTGHFIVQVESPPGGLCKLILLYCTTKLKENIIIVETQSSCDVRKIKVIILIKCLQERNTC